MTQEGQRSRFRAALLLLFFALYFYRLGAANIEGLLNYPFWRDMGGMMSNEDFISLRGEHLWKVFPLLVAPIALLVIVTAALARSGAAPVPRWVFIGALACQSIMVASTAFIQIPIQFELSRSGFDPNLLDRLIATDLMLRKLPSLAEGAFVLFGLWTVIRANLRMKAAYEIENQGSEELEIWIEPWCHSYRVPNGSILKLGYVASTEHPLRTEVASKRIVVWTNSDREPNAELDGTAVAPDFG